MQVVPSPSGGEEPVLETSSVAELSGCIQLSFMAKEMRGVGVKAGAGLNWEEQAWWGLFQGSQGRAEDSDLPRPPAGSEGPEIE